MKYFIVNSGQYVAANPKVATTSFAFGIATQIQNVGMHYPSGLDANSKKYNWNAICSSTETPQGTVYLAVRESLDRFTSSVAEVGVTVDEALDALENNKVDSLTGKKPSLHLSTQVSYINTGCKNLLYRYDQDLSGLAHDIGLSGVPSLNVSESKVTLTPDQAGRVSGIYADDISLYSSITGAATPYTYKPSIPKTVQAFQIRVWLISHGYDLTAIDTAISGISDPIAQKIAQAEWEYATVIPRNHPLLDSVAAALKMTNDQIDTAFIESALI